MVDIEKEFVAPSKYLFCINNNHNRKETPHQKVRKHNKQVQSSISFSEEKCTVKDKVINNRKISNKK